MQSSLSCWDTTSEAQKYYKIEENQIERVLPLFDYNNYYGWHHIVSSSPISNNNTSSYIQIENYSRQDSSIYVGLVTPERKCGQCCGLVGWRNDGCIAYVSWNQQKIGAIRVGGVPICQNSPRLYLSQGKGVYILVDRQREMVTFINSMTKQQTSVPFPEEFVNSQLYLFSTLTNQGDKISVHMN